MCNGNCDRNCVSFGTSNCNDFESSSKRYERELEMNDTKITFTKTEGGLKLFAIYVAQLVREGVTFEVKEYGNEGIGEWIEVHLTGGF